MFQRFIEIPSAPVGSRYAQKIPLGPIFRDALGAAADMLDMWSRRDPLAPKRAKVHAYPGRTFTGTASELRSHRSFMADVA